MILAVTKYSILINVLETLYLFSVQWCSASYFKVYQKKMLSLKVARIFSIKTQFFEALFLSIENTFYAFLSRKNLGYSRCFLLIFPVNSWRSVLSRNSSKIRFFKSTTWHGGRGGVKKWPKTGYVVCARSHTANTTTVVCHVIGCDTWDTLLKSVCCACCLCPVCCRANRVHKRTLAFLPFGDLPAFPKNRHHPLGKRRTLDVVRTAPQCRDVRPFWEVSDDRTETSPLSW